MPIIFEGPALFVSDINESRRFYETVLQQEVLADHGPHVAFKNGFSLWQATNAIAIVFQGKKSAPRQLGQDNFEMYFESDEVETTWKQVEKQWPGILHPIHEHPWGQLGFRIYDPDGHIIEIGEPLPRLVKRLIAQGLSLEEIHERTSIPLPMIKQMAE